MCSNPCESEVTYFRPESNRGPYGLLIFLSAALSTTELWWRMNHRKSFRTLSIKISVCRLYIADPVTLRGESRVVSVFSVYEILLFNQISAFIVSHIWMSNMLHIWMSYVSQICSVSYMECISTSSCIHCAWTRCEFSHFSWLVWINMVARFIMLILIFYGPKFFVGAIGN